MSKKSITAAELGDIAHRIKDLMSKEQELSGRKHQYQLQETLIAFQIGAEISQADKAYGEKVIIQLATLVGISKATAYNYAYLYRGAGFEQQILANPKVTRKMWQIVGMTIAPVKDSYLGMLMLSVIRGKISAFTEDQLQEVGSLIREARNNLAPQLKFVDPKASIDEDCTVTIDVEFDLDDKQATPKKVRAYIAIEKELERLSADINAVLGKKMIETERNNPLVMAYEKFQGIVKTKYLPLPPNLNNAKAILRERNRQRHKLPSRSSGSATSFLLHGDCQKLIGQLKDDSIDVVVTDPPYSKTVYLPWRKTAEKHHDAESDLSKQVEVIANAIEASKLKLRKRACLFIFFPLDTSDVLLQRLRSVFEPSDKIIWQILVWDKQITPKIGGHQTFSRQCEAILYCNINNRPLNAVESKTLFGNIFSHPFTQNDKQYGSWKPIDLLKRIIEMTTDKGDVVLDCFAGVGSTGIACNELGRSSILIEKNMFQFAKAQSNLPDSSSELTPKSA